MNIKKNYYDFVAVTNLEYRIHSIVSAYKDGDKHINDRILSTAVDYRHIVSDVCASSAVDESEIPELI